jgi:hypothetical protein
MKSKSIITLKGNGFDGQFNTLNSNEMINLRGGAQTEPPLPPPPGEDLPIDWSKSKVQTMTTNLKKVALPVVDTSLT